MLMMCDFLCPSSPETFYTPLNRTVVLRQTIFLPGYRMCRTSFLECHGCGISGRHERDLYTTRLSISIFFSRRSKKSVTVFWNVNSRFDDGIESSLGSDGPLYSTICVLFGSGEYLRLALANTILV